MSSAINSVTENRVTVTANDTEENIRASAGFAEPEPTETAKDAPTETPVAAGERNPDGTFKGKAVEKPAEDAVKADGDPRKSIQAKINDAIAKQRAAERRADEAERRATERETELQALRTPKPATEPVKPTSTAPTYLQLVQRYQSHPDMPKFEDFEAAGLASPYEAWQAATSAFVADQRMSEREAAAESTRVARERATHANTAIEIAEQNHPGFTALYQADTVVYPQVVLDLLRDEAASDPTLSAELLHHLLTHPDDAATLAAQTTPIAAAREIGRLTTRVSSASSGPETATTHTTAKPLIKPVRPSVMASESSPPEDLPFGPKYIAAMNERDRKAREARRA